MLLPNWATVLGVELLLVLGSGVCCLCLSAVLRLGVRSWGEGLSRVGVSCCQPSQPLSLSSGTAATVHITEAHMLRDYSMVKQTTQSVMAKINLFESPMP